MPNAGQWEGDFDFRLRQGQTFVYLRANEQRVLLLEPKGHDHLDHHVGNEVLKGHVFSLVWLGADSTVVPQELKAKGLPRLNYLIGKDSARWQSGLLQYREVVYPNLYPKIDLRYYIDEYGFCKFDFIVHPGGDPSLIRWEIKGIEQQGIIEGNITLITSLGSIIYTAPQSFQDVDKIISSSFEQVSPGIYGFEIGKYQSSKILTIDPTLVFSTYSGSTDDNFGFSATYGEGGTAYGAGINYAYNTIHRGFPTSLGAFQDSSQGGVIDVSIAKYTADGSAQIYATYLGGMGNDIPFSLLEGPNKSLIVLGITGSVDFPVMPNSFDTSFTAGSNDVVRIGGSLSFAIGTEIFVSILDSTGGALIGSTFFGDSLSDGNNKRMIFNYGDPARGDITMDNQGNIIVSTNTFSPGLPTGSATNSSYLGEQDGLIISFNPDLSQLNWARYLGGEDNDASFSLRYTNAGRLFITGATESDSIIYDTLGVYQSQRQGKVDAFVTELDPSTGNVLKWTYSGTAEDDRAFFLDYTPDGKLVIFGQTAGAWPWLGMNVWGVPNSSQFLQELTPDLKFISHSTTFGDGLLGVTDISPTALMVSDCGDIFLSGWGAPYNSNLRGVMGDTRGLPVTADAFRDSADSRGDFYFMRLDASWQRLTYATFFGQWMNGADHVDGGSSRFRRDGSIFQAVCSCGTIPYGFPITDNAFEDSIRSGNCNMAVFRFDLEADTVACKVTVAPGFSDSTCLPADIKFWDQSFNADIVLVTDPQGNVDTLDRQLFPILNIGANVFRFMAIDTNCNLIDTSSLAIYAYNDVLQANFLIEYDSCRSDGQVQFTDRSTGVRVYRWDFGDGAVSNDPNPIHTYLPGTYSVQLIAQDTLCGKVDTLQKELSVRYLSDETDITFESDPCDPNRGVRAWSGLPIGNKDYQVLEWYVEGNLIATGDTFNYQFSAGGFYQLKLVFRDSVCKRFKEEERELFYYSDAFEVKFPNVFTPNGDAFNEQFTFLDYEKVAPYLASAYIEIYNRNGQRLFAADLLKQAWDGKHEGVDLPEAVYYYVLHYEDICGTQKEQNGFLHLQR